MRTNFLVAATVGSCLALGMGVASAQDSRTSNYCDRVAADKKAACVEFLDAHVWNEGKTAWELKPGKTYSKPMPKGAMMTKEEIRAARTKFLAENRFDEGKGAWVPIAGKPRDMSDKADAKTRDAVKADTQAFLKTHRFDEGKGAYVPK